MKRAVREAGSITGVLPASEYSIWPDDPDEVPAWRLEAERKAALIGITLPSYRTRREWDVAVDLCIMTLGMDDMPPPDVEVPPLPELPPDRAASEFLLWMRNGNRTGTYSSQKITELYQSFCDETNRLPTSEKLVKQYLVADPFVTKGLEEKRKRNKRHRPTLYVIRQSEPESGLKLVA